MTELHPELARSIVYGLPVGVAVVDSNDRVVWCNAVLGDLLEMALSDIIGRSAEILQLPLPKTERENAE